MDRNELQAAVNKITWRHTIDLSNSVVTPGSDNTPERLSRLAMPTSLVGKTVLDIGAWDGFYSFEVERREAERVVAADLWYPSGWVRKEGFNLAHKTLQSKVETVNLDVMDLTTERLGQFDIVLCLGVLYHLRHPLLALERIYSVTRELLILETHVDMVSRKLPIMTFYPGAELNGDYSNWWGPNPSALQAMVLTAGFRSVKEVSSWPSVITRLRIATRILFANPSSAWTTLNQKRMVLHAVP